MMSAGGDGDSVFLQPGSSGDVPVEHLDYDYIGKCKDVKYLEKILRILRSGSEGIYPHLIHFCESHLEKLEPQSRALRKENPITSVASLPKAERSQIVEELTTWLEETKKAEISQKHQSPSVKERVPPVRGSNRSVTLNQTSAPGGKRNPSKQPLPRAYQDWDKFDVEKECERIDGDGVDNDPPAVINKAPGSLKTEVEASSLTQQEKLLLANRERDKGNEAFRVKDYEEAVAYYSRSLSLLPTVAAYNNRAQAHIHLKLWHEALADCQKVLQLDTGNMKALLRRATVYHHTDKFQLAAADLRTVLGEEPQNATAARLLTQTEEKIKEREPEKRRKAKTIVIEEVEEDDEEASVKPAARPVVPVGRGGGEASSAAPGDGRVMGNAQRKQADGPHGPHLGGWRGRGGGCDKYPSPPGQQGQGGQRDVGAGGGGAAAAAGGGEEEEEEEGGGQQQQPWGSPPGGGRPLRGAAPPLARLKNEGNRLFRTGQFADALQKYSQAVRGCEDSGIDSPEDLCILYSNRAACYLKDGNSHDCIEDCTRALELQPFALKPLLRRAMAYESLERYRKAYVDYKTVLQIDSGVQAANDSVNRITRVLMEQDGPEWRGKLPEIPLVPLSAQQHRREEPPSAELLQARAEKAAREAEKRAEVRFAKLKQEGNDLVKRGKFQDALAKYTECLTLRPDECAIYTNRALCYLKVEKFADAKQDCNTALKLEPTNKKAFYRRALANKGLKDYLACSSDLQEVLQQDPNVQEAERELEEVTLLLRQSLANASPAKPRKTVAITEVDGDDEGSAVPDSETSCRGEDITINLTPTNAYEFGQALSAARCSGNVAACAELLGATSPEKLPQLLSTQLDGRTVSFLMQALDSHLLQKDPDLVYQHLRHLHTAERFSVVLMLLEKDERCHMTQLFEHLSAVESAEFTKNDVQNLANKYI